MLARRYLAIPATSAAVERVFSIGSNVISKSRNRLLPDTVRKLMLLKSWRASDINVLNDILVRQEEEEGEGV